MTMTHEQLHTHGPDELAMLRAECDKWHKAYDRVWEERMRFADRAIELEKENAALKEERRWRKCSEEITDVVLCFFFTFILNWFVFQKRERKLKRKRCLAMAERCKYRAYYISEILNHEIAKIYPNVTAVKRNTWKKGRMYYWRNLWLKLAEKFKEG